MQRVALGRALRSLEVVPRTMLLHGVPWMRASHTGLSLWKQHRALKGGVSSGWNSSSNDEPGRRKELVGHGEEPTLSQQATWLVTTEQGQKEGVRFRRIHFLGKANSN